MDCHLSINFGAAFFWCLTLIISSSSAFASWHGSRIYHSWKLERALQRGQDSLLGAKYTPMGERIPRPRGVVKLAEVERMRVQPKPPEDASQGRLGWRKLEGYPYHVAAE